jgi:hypothetical protein
LLLTRDDRLQLAETLQHGHALRFTENRASGPAAQAVWLRSLPFFNHICPGSRALLTQIFRSISRKKNLEKISSIPPTFFEKLKWGTKGSVPAKFHRYTSKTVACSEEHLGLRRQRNKEKNNVADAPPNPEVLSL